jgi:DNA-binding NarL/FixJ family response regulator
MGGMSGVQAVAPIKRLAPTTQIILFTSLYDSATAQDAYRVGAVKFFSKIEAFRKVLEFAHGILATRAKPLLAIAANPRAAGVGIAAPEPSQATVPAARSNARSGGAFRRIIHLVTPDPKPAAAPFRCQHS